jgi:hypothetical protein
MACNRMLEATRIYVFRAEIVCYRKTLNTARLLEMSLATQFRSHQVI